MNHDFTPAEEAFRGEVRAFVRCRVPPATRLTVIELSLGDTDHHLERFVITSRRGMGSAEETS